MNRVDNLANAVPAVAPSAVLLVGNQIPEKCALCLVVFVGDKQGVIEWPSEFIDALDEMCSGYA